MNNKPRALMVLILISAAIVLICIAALARVEAGVVQTREIFLNPDMPTLNTEGIAPVYPPSPDADKLKVSASIEPQRQYRWIVSPNVPFKTTVRCDDKGVTDCILTILDWDMRAVSINRYKVPFQEKVVFKVMGRGTYLILLDGMKDGKCAWRLVRSFSVCPPNNNKRAFWDTDDFWVGQVSIPGRQFFPTSDGRFAHPAGLSEDESADLDAELVARMGVSVSRIDMPVLRTDQTGMKLDFKKADRCMKMFTSRGLKMDLQLAVPYGEGMGPILPKYNTPYPWVYPITDKTYRYYITETVKRYKNQIRFVQVNNEPDNAGMYGGTPDEFVTMVKQVDEEAARIDSSIQITNGGYCQAQPEKTKIIVPQVKGMTDFVSYHCHSDLPGLKREFANIVRLHRDAGYTNPRFAITEMGALVDSICTEYMGAYIEMQKFFYCWAHRNSGIMLYSSRELDSPRQHANEYGFVDYFFCPRFAYGTISAVLDQYAGMRPYKILLETENLHVYLFKDNNRIMATVFAATNPGTVRLSGNAKNITIIDPMGNVREIGKGPEVEIEAGYYPKTVVFYGVDDVRLLDLK